MEIENWNIDECVYLYLYLRQMELGHAPLNQFTGSEV